MENNNGDTSLPMDFSQETPNSEKIVQEIERPPKYFGQMGDLRSVQELSSKYREAFNFPYFNVIQSKVMDDVLYTDNSVVISAPTGSGKTAIFELAIIRLLMKLEEKQIDDDLKLIYIAPVKALCNERMQDWHTKFSKFGLNSIVMTGDTENYDYQFLEKFNIILTTPEKWDSITRKWRDNKSLVEMVKLFMIDEVHLLGEEGRGAILEVIVTRMKIIQNQLILDKSGAGDLRFMAVSATIPNIEDIAEWLGSQKIPAVCYTISEELRPVKLNKIVLGYPCTPNTSPFKFDMSLTYKLKKVILDFSCGKPILIFCATRKSVEMTCSYLSQNLTFHLSEEQKSLLIEAASQMVDNKMRTILIAGVGSHHAGMSLENRCTIEGLFRDGNLPVLVTTSTLSMGVNLPANLVIIKSTQQYMGGEYREYTEGAVLQMIGRAGRPQFDTSATAVIMTTTFTKAKYEKMVGGIELIESNLHNHLKEHLNSEIALGTITDFYEALNWLQMTFLFIRAQKNPKYYKIPPHLTKDKIEKKFLELCQIEMNDLAQYGMIEQDFYSGIKSTNVGILMAKYYMNFETIKVFKEVQGNENLEQILMLISRCNEFAEIFLRKTDKMTLNTLNKSKDGPSVRFPLRGKIQTIAMKVNCMIQAIFGNLKILNPSLLQESTKIMNIGERVSRCLVEYLEKKDMCFSALLNCLIISKCFRARMWENSKHVVKQINKIGPVLASMLAVGGKTNFKDILESDPRELEVLMNRNPPMGNDLKESVAHVPSYKMEIAQIDFTEISKVEIKIFLQNADKIREKCTIQGSNVMFLIVGNSENDILLFTKVFHSKMASDEVFIKIIEMNFIPKCTIKAYLISENWVGIDCEGSVNLELYDNDGRCIAQHNAMARNNTEGRITRKVIASATNEKNKKQKSKNTIPEYLLNTPRYTFDSNQNRFVRVDENSQIGENGIISSDTNLQNIDSHNNSNNENIKKSENNVSQHIKNLENPKINPNYLPNEKNTISSNSISQNFETNSEKLDSNNVMSDLTKYNFIEKPRINLNKFNFQEKQNKTQPSPNIVFENEELFSNLNIDELTNSSTKTKENENIFLENQSKQVNKTPKNKTVTFSQNLHITENKFKENCQYGENSDNFSKFSYENLNSNCFGEWNRITLNKKNSDFNKIDEKTYLSSQNSLKLSNYVSETSKSSENKWNKYMNADLEQVSLNRNKIVQKLPNISENFNSNVNQNKSSLEENKYLNFSQTNFPNREVRFLQNSIKMPENKYSYLNHKYNSNEITLDKNKNYIFSQEKEPDNKWNKYLNTDQNLVNLEKIRQLNFPQCSANLQYNNKNIQISPTFSTQEKTDIKTKKKMDLSMFLNLEPRKMPVLKPKFENIISQPSQKSTPLTTEELKNILDHASQKQRELIEKSQPLNYDEEIKNDTNLEIENFLNNDYNLSSEIQEENIICTPDFSNLNDFHCNCCKNRGISINDNENCNINFQNNFFTQNTTNNIFGENTQNSSINNFAPNINYDNISIQENFFNDTQDMYLNNYENMDQSLNEFEENQGFIENMLINNPNVVLKRTAVEKYTLYGCPDKNFVPKKPKLSSTKEVLKLFEFEKKKMLPSQNEEKLNRSQKPVLSRQNLFAKKPVFSQNQTGSYSTNLRERNRELFSNSKTFQDKENVTCQNRPSHQENVILSKNLNEFQLTNFTTTSSQKSCENRPEYRDIVNLSNNQNEIQTKSCTTSSQNKSENMSRFLKFLNAEPSQKSQKVPENSMGIKDKILTNLPAETALANFLKSSDQNKNLSALQKHSIINTQGQNRISGLLITRNPENCTQKRNISDILNLVTNDIQTSKFANSKSSHSLLTKNSNIFQKDLENANDSKKLDKRKDSFAKYIEETFFVPPDDNKFKEYCDFDIGINEVLMSFYCDSD